MVAVLASMKKSLLVLILVTTLFVYVEAQQGQDVQNSPEFTNVEKPPKKKGRFKDNWKLPYPNPYRAGVYSLILPGAGQIYNKRYWKAPIVWGGFAALIYSVDYNKELMQCFRDAYSDRARGITDKYADRIPNIQTLEQLRNRYRKNLQMTYIGFVGLYALSALDAYVDAHLKSFDMSDDLSLHFDPFVQGSIFSSSTIGVGLALHF